MMRLDAIYVCYWSLQDPLCQSQSLPYVRSLAAEGWRIAIITFEQDRWRLPPGAAARVGVTLEAEGIEWHPLRYHRRPRALSTAFDVLAGANRCRQLVRSRGARLVHGRGSVACAVAYVGSRRSHAAFFNDADGPLSQEYVDAGLWRQGSLVQRFAALGEGRFVAAADAVAVLSAARGEELASRARAPITTLPCAVDTKHFKPDPAGLRLRSELGLEGTVLVYMGKAGGWYRCDEMMDFARVAAQVLGPVSLLVISTDAPERFLGPAAERGLRCIVRCADRAEIPALLSAGHAGLSFRASAPSQRACSPIKNAEYLACGLPVVSTGVAGDYPELIRRRRVGVVVDEATEAAYRQGARALGHLLGDAGLSERCRAAAVEELDLEGVLIPRYSAIYGRLLGHPAAS